MQNISIIIFLFGHHFLSFQDVFIKLHAGFSFGGDVLLLVPCLKTIESMNY